MYLVTVCTHDREYLFGDVENGVLTASVPGVIVRACWEEIRQHFTHASTDAFVVMPNHVHGIIMFTVGATHASPLPDAQGGDDDPERQTLGVIVGSFKSAVTKRINEWRSTRAAPVWQRGYHERCLWGPNDLAIAREYVGSNLSQWAEDPENHNRNRA